MSALSLAFRRACFFWALIACSVVACGGSEDTGPRDAGGTGGRAGTGGAIVPVGTGGAIGTGGVLGTGGASINMDSGVPDAIDVGPDLVADMSPVEAGDASDAPASCTGNTCTLPGGASGLCLVGTCMPCAGAPQDSACIAAYGAGRLCIGGACVPAVCRDSKNCPEGQQCNTATHQCADCASDTACKNDSDVYGAQFLCLGGKCVKGDCHDSATDCTPGQLCGVDKPHTCGACTGNGQCTADARYGTGFVCAAGKCAKGDCAASNDCLNDKEGQLCGVLVSNTCGNCTQDSQCKNDPRYKDSKPLCNTAAGASNGRCVPNTCAGNGTRCAANAADVCCNSQCVPGACCDGDDTPCRLIGPSHTCVNNTCTTCDAASGNQYFVDPVNGNDVVATGSGKAGGAASGNCMFRTVTRAIELLSGNSPVGTTITIVGASGSTTNLGVAETLPIELPANVKVTTMGGPIALKPAAGKIGFRLSGNGAALAPAAGATLTIDGAGASGVGVLFALADGASATLSNVVVDNTGDDGLRVTGGTAIVNTLTVKDAGSATQKQSGIEVIAGTARLVGSAGNVVIENNSEHGISVSGRGNVEILGAPSGTPGQGGGTVVSRGNGEAGLHLAQDLAAQPFSARKVSDVDGFVAHANRGAGLRVRGGSKLKLRRSVLLANGGAGVLIESAAAGAAGNEVSGIDLGAAGDAGKNVLQTPLGSNPNTGAGICVDLSVGVGAVTIKARGNTFATETGALDCSLATPPAKITISPTCGRFNVGVDAAAGTPVTVELQNCQIQ